MTFLSIDTLSYRYPNGIKALEDISFSIEKGSSVAILGSNGAGKSTLLDLLLGYKRSTSVSLHGKPLSAYGRKELGRLIALVPQKERFSFAYTLLDYTLFGRAPYLAPMSSPTSADSLIAYGALAKVGLEGFENRSITALSGGEQQLLLIARAIAQESEILLLDEPTSSLDPANRKRILTLLKQLHAEGKTLVFTTHDANFAYELSTDIALLKGGKLLGYGKKEEVVKSGLLTTLYDTQLTVTEIDGRTIIY